MLLHKYFLQPSKIIFFVHPSLLASWNQSAGSTAVQHKGLRAWLKLSNSDSLVLQGREPLTFYLVA